MLWPSHLQVYYSQMYRASYCAPCPDTKCVDLVSTDLSSDPYPARARSRQISMKQLFPVAALVKVLSKMSLLKVSRSCQNSLSAADSPSAWLVVKALQTLVVSVFEVSVLGTAAVLGPGSDRTPWAGIRAQSRRRRWSSRHSKACFRHTCLLVTLDHLHAVSHLHTQCCSHVDPPRC